jgi:hypothetical protein
VYSIHSNYERLFLSIVLREVSSQNWTASTLCGEVSHCNKLNDRTMTTGLATEIVSDFAQRVRLIKETFSFKHSGIGQGGEPYTVEEVVGSRGTRDE